MRAGKFTAFGIVYAALQEMVMNKCSKCGHERGAADRGDPGVGSSCGLVYAKWVSRINLVMLAWGVYLLMRQYRNLDRG